MSEFEFVLIPVGIVVGLAIALVLQSWGAVINYPIRESKPGLFFSASGLVLAVVFLNFAGLWSYRKVLFAFPEGAVVTLLPLLMIMPVLLMFLAIAVVIPKQTGQTSDLSSHYFSVAQKFFLVFGLALLSSTVPDLIPGVGWTLTWAQVVPVPLACFVLASTKLRLVHIVGHCLIWLFILTGYAFDFLAYLDLLES